MPQLTLQQAFDLAVQHHQSGRLQQAEQIYRQILAQEPNHAPALQRLGAIAAQAGRNDAAVDLIRRSIALNPTSPEAHCNLGLALIALGQLDQAIAAFRQAVALKPNSPQALSNLGTVLGAQGRLEEAIATFRQVLAIRPDLAGAHYNLGNALGRTGNTDEAIAAYRHALTLNPGLAEAHSSLGNALKDKGQIDEAIAAFRQAIALKPNLREAHSNLVFTLHYLPGSDAQTIAEELRRWEHQHAAPLKHLIQPDPNDRSPDRRLRIGYVSADFWAHASSFFLVPLLEHHDPQQVELFCYAQVPRPDEITRRLQQCVTQWRSTVGLSDEQVANQIRADRIDILVDLKLHTAHNRLLVFARKPAPVQVTWLGYPGSTGLRTIDYRLSDPYLDPPGMDESVYSEQTIRLPDTFWCYDPLAGRDVPINSLPVLSNGFITFGSLNNFRKINAPVLRLWAQVLLSAPSSRLLLLAPEGSHRRRTSTFLAQEGIEPSRIEFLAPQPRRLYLELYHRIDLGLDSFPVNGHTTSLDSFWMGVPVVTLVGQAPLGRAGWSQLSNLRLTELAAQSPDQYVRIAAALANDLPRLTNLRATLRQRMQQSPLMDSSRFARNIESAYRHIWQKWGASTPRQP